MAFRTLVVSSHSKLEYSLGYFVFRTAEKTSRINISEIQCIIIESTAVAITGNLLCEIIRNNICLIFCDEKKNPYSQLLPLYGSYNTYKKYSSQISWSKTIKDEVWKLIVQQKILGESTNLKKEGFIIESDKLKQYIDEVTPRDLTNREGHASKVYFNKIFGENFTRSDDSIINIYLNYGYSILASYINRTICSLGYLTQFGIHHIGADNPFNFTYDLIETFRVFVDIYIKRISQEDNFKLMLANILNENIKINDKSQTIANALSIYVQSVISALNESNTDLIIFPDSYEL